jgi:hypothetical protein
VSQDKFDFILKWVDEAFPHDMDDYSVESLCVRFISTISLSLLFFQYPNEGCRPQDLESYHQYLVRSNAVLQVLPSITQSQGLSFESEEAPSKMSQKARKYARRTRQTAKSVDMTPFQALHLEVPGSPDEGKEMAQEILATQKDILMVTVFVP